MNCACAGLGRCGNRIETYLDNAATAPMRSGAIESVSRAMREVYGNPSSRHAKGRAAKALLEESRSVVADAIGASPDEIYFTSGGTESNNLAIAGACAAFEREHGPGTIVTTALEHPSVTKTVRGLKRQGWSVVYLDAAGGDLDILSLEKALRSPNAVSLVSVMSVQSELGYRFPLEDIVSICRSFGQGNHSPLVHTDAVQAFGKWKIDVDALGVDLMSFCSHKIGGPKGVGALYVRRGTRLFTTAFGGGQECGLRSGTEAVPLIAGFASAVQASAKGLEEAYSRAGELRDRLVRALSCRYKDVIVNSRDDGSPYIVNFTLPGTDNRVVLDRLSDAGVYLSASMACSSNHATVPPGTWRKKHPLALQLAGVPARLTHCTYRVSFSDLTTFDDVDRLLEELGEVVPVHLEQRSV